MSQKVSRGTKRSCQSCGSRFYDLNRDPIACPVCNAAFVQSGASKQAEIDAAAELAEQALKASKAALLAKEAAAAAPVADGEELPDAAVEDELADIETDVEIADGEAEDTFLEEEEDAGSDVADLIDNPLEDGEEEEV